jgi:hypothetical protein
MTIFMTVDVAALRQRCWLGGSILNQASIGAPVET